MKNKFLLTLLLLIMCTLSALSQTTTPKHSVQMNIAEAPTVTINSQRYDNPAIRIVRTSDGRNVRGHYRLSYSLANPTSKTTTNSAGYKLETDATTGSVLNTFNGHLDKVGDKFGTFTVNVTATLTSKYSGKGLYPETVTGSYTITIKAPSEFKITVDYQGNAVNADDTLGIIRSKINEWNWTEKSIVISKPTITYQSDNGMTIDATNDFDITRALSDGLTITEGKEDLTIKSTKTETTKGQHLTFTATVKDGMKASYGSDAKATFTVNLRTSVLAKGQKIQTYLVFDKHELTKYKISFNKNNSGDGSFKSPYYKVVDADGNDYTDCYSFDGQGNNSAAVAQNIFEKYSIDPLDSGGDLSGGSTKAKFESLRYYPNYRKHHTDGIAIGWPANSEHRTTGAAWIPDDYIATVKLTMSNGDWKGILSDEPAIAKPGEEKKHKIKGQFYDYNNENLYEIGDGQYVMHVLKRVPKIKMIPAPEDVQIAHNYVMTSFNRFDLYGVFNDEASDFKTGEDWKLHLGTNPKDTTVSDNDFWYVYFVPDESSWDSTLVKNNMDSVQLESYLKNHDGIVKVQVSGSLTNNGRYYKNMHMLMPVYATEQRTAADGSTYTAYKLGDDGKPIPIYIEGTQTQKMELKKGTMYISQREFKNDEGAWKVTFHGKGNLPLNYIVIPWNPTGWDVGSISNAHMFTITDAEDIHYTLDPKSFIIPVGQTAKAPTVKVTDNFGKDLTDFFSFTWTKDNDENNEITKLNGTTTSTGTEANEAHTSLAIKEGEVTVSVKAAKTDVTSKTLDEWLNKYNYNPAVYKNPSPDTQTYTVKVVGSLDDLGQYEIIYDSLGYYKFDANGKVILDGNGLPMNDLTKWKTDKMGKLHFIKAGKFYAGTVSEDEAPGITITFGNGNDNGLNNWSVATSKVNVKTDGDYDKSGNAIIIQGDNPDFDGQDAPDANTDWTKATGGIVKLEPTTNGFLTLDGRFGTKDDNIRYYLRDVTANYTQSIERPTTDADGNKIDDATEWAGERKFPYALLEDHTYYLWCSHNDNGFFVHGLQFKPAFVVMRQDTDPAHRATMFLNGFTGDIPQLVSSNKGPEVTFTESYDDGSIEAKKIGNGDKGYKPSDLLTIEDNYRYVAKNYTMGERVRTRAAVRGITRTITDTDGNEKTVIVKRNPYLDVSIVALPMYKPTPYDAIVPGKRVTTTNFVTRMWMTWGGWEKDSKEFPYYRKNVIDSTKANNNQLYDTYIQARFDTVGANNRTIDGFRWASYMTGNSNPTDENVEPWYNYDYNTFTLPVRGDYAKFEPEESGTLMVYVLQNGMTDIADDRPTYKVGSKNRPNALRRRATYIVDETGNPVHIPAKAGKWTSIGKYFDDDSNTNESSENKNYVTEGHLRTSWSDKSPIAAIAKDGFQFQESDWGKYYKEGKNDPGFIADSTEITKWWKATATHDPYDKLQEVFRLSDSSFVIPTKAYVRYTFDVKAGKTYYVFTMGSKLGFAGFAFIPDGFMGNSGRWPQSQPTADGEEYDIDNAQDIAARAKLPEPDDEIYGYAGVAADGKEATGVGYYDQTLSDSKRKSGSKETDPNMLTGAGGTASSTKLVDAKVNFVNITLDRSFTPDEWTSICLPFSLSEHQVKEIFGTNSQLITFDSVMTAHKAYRNEFYKTDTIDVAERTAHFTYHVNQLIEAGRPYFLKPTFKIVDEETAEESVPADVTFDDDGNATAITFKHVSLEAAKPMDIISTNKRAKKAGKKIFTFNFKGIYDREQIPWYSYVMITNAKAAPAGDDGNGLWRIVPSAGHTAKETRPYLKGFRAYLYPSYDEDGNTLEPTATTNPAKLASFWITGADVYGNESHSVDGIEQLVDEFNTMLTTGMKGVYNLKGQRVRATNDLSGLPAGVYIMNGKKYVTPNH